MSLRSFTVFQDTPSNEQLPSKEVTLPLSTRSLTHNNVASSNSNTTTSTPDLDKENYDPVTGERAGPGSNTAGKKRKTSVLITKVQPKMKKDSQPEKKKLKPSPPSSIVVETKPTKKSSKRSGSVRKGKRTSSRKVSPMPQLPEEDEVGKATVPVTPQEIDSRCKELTLKPLADVSEAYDGLLICGPSPSSNVQVCEAKLGKRTIKASSVEPEIRDYFEPSESLFASTSVSKRLSDLSEVTSKIHSFSTPERKKIYAAFTFSSPTLIVHKTPLDDDTAPPSTSVLA